jgi:peptidoglycan-N-acetylglucosamine deacetylase
MVVSALGGGCLLAAAALMAYGVRHPASQMFAPSVQRGPAEFGPRLALTFDDGPSESTPQLLEILACHDVRATFFLCGANARRLPQIARSIARAGHEIGNHSDTHQLFYAKSRHFLWNNVSRAQQSIEETTGVTPRLFRAPYGVRWFGLGDVQRGLGLTGVMWTVLGLDWKLPPPQVTSRILQRVSPGGIICLHDGRALQVQPDVSGMLLAVRQLLPMLLERGFRFYTVSELLCPRT